MMSHSSPDKVICFNANKLGEVVLYQVSIKAKLAFHENLKKKKGIVLW